MKRILLSCICISFLVFLGGKVVETVQDQTIPQLGYIDDEGYLRLKTFEQLQEYSPQLSKEVEADYQKLYDLASSKTKDFSISGDFSIKDGKLHFYYMTANMAIDDILVTANYHQSGEIYVQTSHYFNIDKTPYQVYAKAIAHVASIDENLVLSAAKSLYGNVEAGKLVYIKQENSEGHIVRYEEIVNYYLTLKK